MPIYGSNIMEYKFELLSEAYIGKTDTLLEIEKQIGLIRQNVSKFSDINRSPEVLKLNRLFEKQFGMDVFALYVEKNNTINAYTVPVAKNFDIAFKYNLSKMVTGNKESGYRFKEGNNLCIICNIFYGLLMYNELTDAELLAVILHELGHNFADAIYSDIRLANQTFMVQLYKQLIWNTILTLGLMGPTNYMFYRKYTNKYKNKQNKKTRKRHIKGLLSGIKGSIDDFKMYINEILNRLSGSSTKQIYDVYRKDAEKKGVPDKVKKSLGRQNEVIADKFAGLYGYGSELISALVKMNNFKSKASETVDKIPVIGKMNNVDYNDMLKDIYKFDEHPHIIQRLNEEIKTLEYEASKADIDPKLIEAMQNQINQLKALRDQITEINNKMTEEQKSQADFYKSVNELDPDAVDEEIEKAIAAAFDDVFED